MKDRAAFRIVAIVGVAALVASLAGTAYAMRFSAWARHRSSTRSPATAPS